MTFSRAPEWNRQSLELPKVSRLGPYIQYKLFNREYRASEVLSRKRPLTLAMIRALHEKLGIPFELLIREPAAEYRVSRRSRKAAR